MPVILNIETATEICSVAVSKGLELLALKEAQEPYVHSSKITLLIEACLQEANLALPAIDAVALSQGPGSYTALRVGTSAAKGICYALDKPLLAIDTLEALALAGIRQHTADALYAPMIDARRMEVYTTLFDKDLQSREATSARIINETSYSEYFDQGQAVVFLGNGAGKCRAVIQSPLAHFLDLPTSASHLVPLALKAYENRQFSDVAYFSPAYFKSPNITKPKQLW